VGSVIDDIAASLAAETARLQAGVQAASAGVAVGGGGNVTYAPSYTFQSPNPLGTRDVLLQMQFEKQQARLLGMPV